ncbi:hypothetical protein ASD00_36355 [Ensifer sp. Root31]|nr:hypothetical protein ASD00_36355 [Ensifer sp. Root31]
MMPVIRQRHLHQARDPLLEIGKIGTEDFFGFCLGDHHIWRHRRRTCAAAIKVRFSVNQDEILMSRSG